MGKKLLGILLAAGNSSRLGQAKQLVKYRNLTLLEYAIQQIYSNCSEIYVIIGSINPHLQIVIDDLAKRYPSVSFRQNPNWQEGMGNSLGFGLNLIKKPQNCLIHLVDLPRVNHSHIQLLEDKFNLSPKKFAVSMHRGLAAPPCIIPMDYCKELSEWKGTHGLNFYFKANPDRCNFIELGIDFLDVDTPDDLSLLGINP